MKTLRVISMGKDRIRQALQKQRVRTISDPRACARRSLAVHVLIAHLMLTACASGGGSADSGAPPSGPHSPPPSDSSPPPDSGPSPDPNPLPPDGPPQTPPPTSLNVPVGTSGKTELVPVRAINLSLGRAFGAGPDLGGMITLDQAWHPYWLNLRHVTRAAPSSPDLVGWLAPTDRQVRFTGHIAPNMSYTIASLHDGMPRGEYNGGGNLTLSAGFRKSDFSIARGRTAQRHFGLLTLPTDGGANLLSTHAFESPYLGLMGVADAVSLTHELNSNLAVRVGVASDHFVESERTGRTNVLVTEVIMRPSNALGILIQFGDAVEEGRLLGARGGGPLALPSSSSTTFAGMAGFVQVNEMLEVFGQASLGFTEPGPPRSGLISSISDIRSSNFAIGMARTGVFIADDRLTLALSQPLRVDKGAAAIERPVGWSADGSILRDRESISLEPEGRELDVELGYQRGIGEYGSADLSWVSQLNPGHDRTASPAHALAIRMRVRF